MLSLAPAHPAVVLPLRGLGLPLSALVVGAALDDVGELRLGAASDADVVALVDALTQTSSRLTAQLTRTFVEADRRRVGDEIGARNTASW